ncbi:hypothetical protein, partial [Desulfovibrio sp.]|uniref:hypothetical protein n=1 Tax=Desulfovibrio sp. TaxID=885 RepID=UPI002A75D402
MSAYNLLFRKNIWVKDDDKIPRTAADGMLHSAKWNDGLVSPFEVEKDMLSRRPFPTICHLKERRFHAQPYRSPV